MKLQYMTKNKNSLLSKITGLFKITILTNTLYFIVMENIFKMGELKPEVVYDLKGSIVNRKSKKKSLLLDVDWIESNEKLDLSSEHSNLLIQQIKNDAFFLKDLNLMDYSLLLGIFNVKDNLKYFLFFFQF